MEGRRVFKTPFPLVNGAVSIFILTAVRSAERRLHCDNERNHTICPHMIHSGFHIQENRILDVRAIQHNLISILKQVKVNVKNNVRFLILFETH